jgi:hypothetical protein
MEDGDEIDAMLSQVVKPKSSTVVLNPTLHQVGGACD